MEQLDQFVEWLSKWFALPLVATLMSTGIYFTIRFRFVQVRRFGEAFRETLASRQTSASGPLSPLQAFMTSLAATIGTGNIAGVATALVQGGPGALFWIWCYGFFAMATKFSEASLGMHFRVAHGDNVLSGPMYYLRDGLKSPVLAWIFALLAAIGVLFTTPMTQTNSVADVVNAQIEYYKLGLGVSHIGNAEIELNRLAVALVLAVLTWLVIVRGIKSIGRAAEKLSPLKVGLYLIGGAIVIGMHIGELPAVMRMVFGEAFSLKAAAGGAWGLVMFRAIRFGVVRGVYANEAGYGTAAVVYGTAKSQRPEQQGLAAMMEVFLISFITSSISALAILLTGVWKIPGAEGASAVSTAFNASIPTYGGWMLTISVFLFGYTVLIGWSFYGEQFLEYMFGRRVIVPYRWFYCLLIPFGAIVKVKTVWNWGDICNGLQVFPNVIGLIGLSGIAAAYACNRNPRDGGTIKGSEGQA
jgi:AGCS family alanine or glycine:cation symporter